MRLQNTSLRSWLSWRIRLLCLGAFVVSLFLPIYVPESGTVLPTDLEEDLGQRYILAEDGFLMKTSSLTEQGTRGAFAQGILHTVEPKETIDSIAKLYDLQPDTIRNANKLDEKAKISPGQQLLILPVDGVIHTVKRGQNLSAIAQLYSVPTSKIAAQNKIRNGYLLAGQELIIPGGKPIVAVVSAPPTVKPGAKPPQVVQVPPRMSSDVEAKPPYEISPTGGILQWPCDCFITQGYSTSHYAIDVQHRGGGPIFAANDGVIIRADYGWNGGYGNVIEIDHGNGMITLYGHNKALHVRVGDRVKRGQFISDMGNTGLVHGPTGIHLHFEVHVNGIKRNPLLYLQE